MKLKIFLINYERNEFNINLISMIKCLPLVIKDINNNDKNVLIEIQGEINHTEETNFERMKFCEIKMKNETEAVMYVGNHYILGKLVKLKNPIALLKKERGIVSIKETKEIHLVTIFKEKIFFNVRPTPKLNSYN